MKTKYNSLDELRTKKALLKKDIADIEDLLTFDNTKESLSAFTHGFTDKFLGEEVQPDGETKTVVKTPEIIKEVSNSVKDSVLNRSAVLGFAKSDAGVNVIENALKIGAVTFIGNYAKKNMQSTSWKKRAIGLGLIYVAPIALRFLRKKLDEYQHRQTTNSMQQLI